MTFLHVASDRLAAHLPSGTAGSGRRAAALSGLLAAGTAIAVGHLVAVVVAPAASPLLAVGSTFIDLTPEWLKSFAIRTFGSNDKIALLSGIALVLAVLAVVIGLIGRSRPGLAVVAIGALGLVGGVAALIRPGGSAISLLPAVAGSVSAMVALVILERAAAMPAEAQPSSASDGASRRGFLTAAVGVGVLIAVSGGLGALISGRRSAAVAGAGGPAIPTPIEPAAAVPAGADLALDGVAPFITPNAAFYRVDTALQVPAIAPDEWRLRIHGMVDREVTLTLDDLLAYPVIERDITLTCVSNTVGGDYVGNARWIGVPLATLLEAAGVQPGATQIVSRSIDDMSIGTPTAVALDGRDAMLAVAMNGETLPAVHGYPVRLIVPGLYGYVSATKWLIELELTTFEAYDPYWVQRGWAKEGPIKTMARIDSPKPLARVAPGKIAVAGVAWAQHRGIDRVEVRVDGGPWQETRLAAVDTIDTWRQWVYEWDAPSGNHSIEARATDAAGDTQTDARAEPFPNGASGWHSVVMTVT